VPINEKIKTYLIPNEKEGIIKVAQDENVDLIVVGSRGLGTLQRFKFLLFFEINKYINILLLSTNPRLNSPKRFLLDCSWDPPATLSFMSGMVQFSSTSFHSHLFIMIRRKYNFFFCFQTITWTTKKRKKETETDSKHACS
jgi:hypothetical protein